MSDYWDELEKMEEERDAQDYAEAQAYKNGWNDALHEFKNIWDERVKDLIDWCKDKRLIGLQQADFIFDEIAEQLKEQKK